ncbi:hypothetical protein O9K63_14305 [Janibacter cremeus]|uniref:hypothetical protein n=1 Tax=Janibacter cremeus TaxID=1285192 RepID=UPI0023F6E731|nr:hypothetical protein [Janibacter cremeus]WEV77749.1 hypothetical protein O9K63_14305 [Janibacter cremeus]
MTRSRIALTTLTTASVLAVAACGSDGTSEDTTTSSATSSSQASPASGSESDPSGPSGEVGDLERVLAAIEAAVAEAGGTAYEIEESDDDGIWEVEVAEGVHGVALEVKPNHDVTEHEEFGLHPEAREGLDQAEIGLGSAVETAMSEVDGSFDETRLIEIDGQHYWKVTVDTAATEEEDDDHQVLVDVTDGTATVEK